MNLNEAFPKDSYLLSNIDKLVDNALSFKDAFTEYNQLKRHPDDEDKIAFII